MKTINVDNKKYDIDLKVFSLVKYEEEFGSTLLTDFSDVLKDIDLISETKLYTPETVDNSIKYLYRFLWALTDTHQEYKKFIKDMKFENPFFEKWGEEVMGLIAEYFYGRKTYAILFQSETKEEK